MPEIISCEIFVKQVVQGSQLPLSYIFTSGPGGENNTLFQELIRQWSMRVGVPTAPATVDTAVDTDTHISKAAQRAATSAKSS